MTYIRELLDRCGGRIELEFVRKLGGGPVHIAVPIDPDVEPEFLEWHRMTPDQAFRAVLNLCRRTVPTLCGREFRVFLDDSGPYEMVDTFPDGDLCWSCHRALGPEHAHRAFEHPQPALAGVR